MAIEWQDKYTIGDRKIDAEHQQLFRLANKFLLAGGPQSMQESSAAFSQYTHQHFFHEENLMREIQYPFTATHAKEHAPTARGWRCASVASTLMGIGCVLNRVAVRSVAWP